MNKRFLYDRIALISGIVFIIFFLATSNVPAQSGIVPHLDHSSCTNACMVDEIFLRSDMGDAQASGAFYGWIDTYYRLTGCGDDPFYTAGLYVIDVISDAVGAPGGYTLQCWQGLLAQAKDCSDKCSDHFTPNGNFAPNIHLSLDSGSPGYLDVSVDNYSYLEELPERANSAYSRSYTLQTTIQHNDGQVLLIDKMDMPRLSYPNWTNRGGVSDCINAFGADNYRCKLISYYAIPSIGSNSVSFFDGGLYDLTDHVSNQEGVSGSFSQDGYIVLYGDGDRITINQGPYAGFAWVKTHNKSSESHTQQLIRWDASTGAVPIINHECDYLWCRISGDRVESDTYVFALRGPAENLLPGTYNVEVVADIVHDKDITDNKVSYSYDASSIDNQQEEDVTTQEDSQEESIGVEDLPIIYLPGPGIYPNNIPDGVPGLVYRLIVPEGIHFMFLRLVSLDGGQLHSFVRRGSLPVPDYPRFFTWEYHCWAQANASYSGGCPFTNPYPDAYYIFVSPRDGSAFQLEVEWTTSAEAATQIARQTQEAEQEQEELVNLFSEVEPNDSRIYANPWDMQQPFTGQIAQWGDHDTIQINIPEPGIYTFSVAEVSMDMKVKMYLAGTNSGYLDSSFASAKGDPIDLTFDASAGEQYFFSIQPISVTAYATNLSYQLVLTGFLPDPDESNDEVQTATDWELSEGPVIGYFWDVTRGRADYFRFTAPHTLDGTPVTFELSNPSPDQRIRLTLLNAAGGHLINTPYSTSGQPVTLTDQLEPDQEYVLKLEVRDLKTSLQPYILSAQYTPGIIQNATQESGRTFRLHGFVYRQAGIFPIPIQDVSIYAQVSGQPAILLDTTGFLGTYSATLTVSEGQQVQIWALKDGITFEPEGELWSPEPRSRSHRSVFVATGAEIFQQTPTPTSESEASLLPPLIQTALTTSMTTNTPVVDATPLASTPTPPQTQPITVISGYAWRLFPNSPPAGVGAAQLFLSINGADQQVVLSGIDGFYQMEIPGLQPGDLLRLRAEGLEDDFEPIYYSWQAEAGVDKWQYEFYSYRGTITPPSRDDQNLIHGWVLDDSGHGVPGVYLVLQIGTSDALQRMGPTNSDGYYEANVRLPNRVMATVWVEQPGYLPSRILFFHPYASEDRELNFRLSP